MRLFLSSFHSLQKTKNVTATFSSSVHITNSFRDLSQRFKQPSSVSVCEQLAPCGILNVRLASSSPPLSFSSSSAWRWLWCRRWIVRRHKWEVPAKNLRRGRQISLSRAQQASLIITFSSSVSFIISLTETKQDHLMQLPKTLSFATNIRVTLSESPMQ